MYICTEKEYNTSIKLPLVGQDSPWGRLSGDNTPQAEACCPDAVALPKEPCRCGGSFGREGLKTT